MFREYYALNHSGISNAFASKKKICNLPFTSWGNNKSLTLRNKDRFDRDKVNILKPNTTKNKRALFYY